MPPKKLSAMGERIQAGMIASGISSARELARRAGVSNQTLHRWMHEDIKAVDAAMLISVSDAVGLSGRWVLYGVGSPHKHLPVTPSEAQLVYSYRALPSEAKHILMHCVADLSLTT